MPKLIIDDISVAVPEGTKVIEAAEQVGIHIPRFCYHPALGSVGACRVCAVKFLQGPFKGVQMSCMIEAADGMVVSTTDPEAVDFRRHVIEWLMINHPHDCPVCDEGGHCLLQDMTVSGGHGMRRYQGKKRTYLDQDLGPLVQHEMNRCIQCYRCSRFYQEYAGYRDLGVMGIASRVYYGRFGPGTLKSPFSGNLIDICPTGVYTDRPSRYKGRRWDYERTPSVCIHCCLGCRITVNVRYREVVRIEARYSPTVNGHFICDRGRYGFFYASSDRRPRKARSGGAETRPKNARDEAAHRLEEITARHGSGSVAVVGGSRSTLETLAAERRICRQLGWQGPSLFTGTEESAAARRAAGHLTTDLAVSLEALKNADLILVAGADPINEAPMAALAIRQAARNGAHIEVIDPRPVTLPLEYVHRPAGTDKISEILRGLGKPSTEDASGDIQDLAARLDQSRRPVVVCGAGKIASERTVEQAARLARNLRRAGKKAGLFFVMTGANTFAACRMAGDPADLETLLLMIEDGKVRALVVVEADPMSEYPDLARLVDALAKLDLMVVLDCIDTETARAAHVFFPTQTFFETGGTLINNEARIQQARPAFAGGTPISQTGGGSHPPRVFRDDIPGTEALSAGQLLMDIVSALSGGISRSVEEFDGVAPEFSGFDPVEATGERGTWAKLPLRTAAGPDSPQMGGETPIKKGELLLVESVYGTEALSRSSPWLQELESEPALTLHPEDASRWGLQHGDRCELSTEAGALTVPVHTSRSTAPGTLVLPRHRRLRWQVFQHFRSGLDTVRIRKTGGEGA
ncbi:MAG: NADH-quinone oxidoreductase subunit NuoG [Desulfobacterales bacterium]|nr:NADH-quinone oxidoreductase subunit NuoG [Desulfobacterales bacterium]